MVHDQDQDRSPASARRCVTETAGEKRRRARFFAGSPLASPDEGEAASLPARRIVPSPQSSRSHFAGRGVCKSFLKRRIQVSFRASNSRDARPGE
jgi:hypothetical protein